MKNEEKKDGKARNEKGTCRHEHVEVVTKRVSCCHKGCPLCPGIGEWEVTIKVCKDCGVPLP